MQHVKYECIKSELKEEYNKKMNAIDKKLSAKAMENPSYLLLNNMSLPPKPNTIGQKKGQFEMKDDSNDMLIRRRVAGSIKSGNRKQSNQEQYALWDEKPVRKENEDKPDKNSYYKFYLDNAQKAIDLMISQHKR